MGGRLAGKRGTNWPHLQAKIVGESSFIAMAGVITQEDRRMWLRSLVSMALISLQWISEGMARVRVSPDVCPQLILLQMTPSSFTPRSWKNITTISQNNLKYSCWRTLWAACSLWMYYWGQVWIRTAIFSANAHRSSTMLFALFVHFLT